MEFIKKFSIVAALGLLAVFMAYINSQSLLFLIKNNDFAAIHKIFAVDGALAFSMVTIIIMRTSIVQWPKIVFPVFDGILFFLGMNINSYNDILNGTDNPFRFWLTVFMSVFVGLIMYCLGIIKLSKTDIIKIQSDNESLKKKNADLEKTVNKYKQVYLTSESSRILKKKPENRKIHEVELLEEAKKLKL